MPTGLLPLPLLAVMVRSLRRLLLHQLLHPHPHLHLRPHLLRQRPKDQLQLR